MREIFLFFSIAARLSQAEQNKNSLWAFLKHFFFSRFINFFLIQKWMEILNIRCVQQYIKKNEEGGRSTNLLTDIRKYKLPWRAVFFFFKFHWEYRKCLFMLCFELFLHHHIFLSPMSSSKVIFLFKKINELISYYVTPVCP